VARHVIKNTALVIVAALGQTTNYKPI